MNRDSLLDKIRALLSKTVSNGCGNTTHTTPILALAIALSTAAPAAAQTIDPFSRPSDNVGGLEGALRLIKRMEHHDFSGYTGEGQQVNRAPPVAAPKPPKMADRYVLPPEQYDHPYTGKLETFYDQSDAVRATVCPRAVYGTPIACALRNGPGGCIIVLGPDEVLRARGWSVETVIRHETGHCNGWSADHRNARLATDPNWINP